MFNIARRLPWSIGSADMHLTAGMAMLTALEQGAGLVLRWYCLTPPALLLGSAQSLDVIDTTACGRRGVTVHRRRSGGGAVLGDETLLMLDVALPHEHPLYLHDVTASYRWLGEVWSTALRNLGLTTRAVSITEARADAQTLTELLKQVCFGGLSPYETAVGQRKVVGLAQICRRSGALFQCGVHLKWEPMHTAELLVASAQDRSALVKQLSARVAGLDEVLGRAVDPIEIIASFEAALARLVGITTANVDWDATEPVVCSEV
jgi:lipoate-protein ligase A